MFLKISLILSVCSWTRNGDQSLMASAIEWLQSFMML